ncbi:hypothetical protein M3Y99_01234500 [Aphelenchoides fujianensis]|nr:hypothetical protein M3Y99_01234500 [Aphelenchoides fujianensis]
MNGRLLTVLFVFLGAKPSKSGFVMPTDEPEMNVFKAVFYCGFSAPSALIFEVQSMNGALIKAVWMENSRLLAFRLPPSSSGATYQAVVKYECGNEARNCHREYRFEFTDPPGGSNRAFLNFHDLSALEPSKTKLECEQDSLAAQITTLEWWERLRPNSKRTTTLGR